jgi:predicted deacetylase
MEAHDHRRACISVHNVTPATWPACERLLRMVDSMGHIPITLLVVPDFRRLGRIDRFPSFIEELEGRVSRGDELALHGYCHLDESRAPRGPLEWLARRVLSNDAEFAALDFEPARKRVQLGLSVMSALGWRVRGFVPPAWLLGEAAREALVRFNLTYTCVRSGVYRLPSWEFHPSPSLAVTAGARWKHRVSEGLNRAMLPLVKRGDLVRLALHPGDTDVPGAMDHWRHVIEETLRTHRPVTMAEWTSGEHDMALAA